MPRAGVIQTRTFVYDPVTLLLTSMTSPETGTAAAGNNPAANGTTSYTYNADGTLATRTDPKGQVTTYSYDNYQRVTTVTHGPSATQTYSNQTYNYTYDSGTNGWGQLTGVSFGPVVSGSNYTYNETYGYTVAGDMSSKGLTVYNPKGYVGMSGAFAYDSEGKPATLTYPLWGYASAGTVQTYTYDSMSRLTGVSNNEVAGPVTPCTPASPTSGTVTWATGGTYNAAGQLTYLSRFAGGASTCTGYTEGYLNEYWQYNALNQLTEIDTGSQGAFLARYHFSATQNNGQVTSVDDARQSGANIVYSYDAMKRLTKAMTASWTQNIGYDGFGNITAKDAPPGSAEPTFPGAVSSKNWLAGVNYDLNGNALAVNAFALTYDAENRLATATSGSAVESYSYDESNHRVEKIFGASDYIYFYGPGGRLLSIREVTNGTTSVVADRVYFGGLLLGTAGNGPSYDVTTMTDRLGTAAAGYPYGTYIGNVSTGNDQPDFATYTKDATTGFEYASQRYYSAGLGRFITVDPSAGSETVLDPSSWNRYSYVGGDPVNLFDPFGLIKCGDLPVQDGGLLRNEFLANSDVAYLARDTFGEAGPYYPNSSDPISYGLENLFVAAALTDRWRILNFQISVFSNGNYVLPSSNLGFGPVGSSLSQVITKAGMGHTTTAAGNVNSTVMGNITKDLNQDISVGAQVPFTFIDANGQSDTEYVSTDCYGILSAFEAAQTAYANPNALDLSGGVLTSFNKGPANGSKNPDPTNLINFGNGNIPHGNTFYGFASGAVATTPRVNGNRRIRPM